MKERRAALLRVAFLAGALVDGAALLPMLFPPLAGLLLGFNEASVSYRFAMNYAAALMFGWTVLLAWAYRRPIERSFVGALTVLVIWGLVLTEIIAVRAGVIGGWRMAPTWVLQAGLLLLFASAYHYPFRMKGALGRWTFLLLAVFLAGCATAPKRPESVGRGDYATVAEYASALVRHEMKKRDVTGLSIALVDGHPLRHLPNRFRPVRIEGIRSAGRHPITDTIFCFHNGYSWHGAATVSG